MTIQHAIPAFTHSDYTLQWHEQDGKIIGERIFPDGTHDQKQYLVEIPQTDPPISPSIPFREMISHLLRQSYVPTISGKKIVWLPADSSQIASSLSKRPFSLVSDNPSSSSSLKPTLEVNNNKKFKFEREVHVRGNFNIHAENLEINNLTVHTPSFLKSLVEGIFNLPLPPQNFTGRKEVFEELHTLCQNNKRVIVSGLGGIGKTAIVLKYAEQQKAKYSFVHFIPAATWDFLVEGLLHLANEQKIPPGEPQERLEMLKHHLNRFQKPFLLIFDGLDSAQSLEQLIPLLPHQCPSVLVTSRLAHQGEESGFIRLELSPFTKEEAISYFLKETGDQDKNQASLLAHELGYLPLAIKHAAAYIKKNRYSLKDYLRLFKQHGVKLQDIKYLRTSQEKTILNTWEISLAAITQQCKPSIQVAHFLSSLASAPVPKTLLKEWFQDFIDNSELEFTRALGYLEDYSLLQITEDVCNMHTLVQQVVLSSLSEGDHKKYLQEALTSLDAYTHLDAQIPKERSLLTLFVPHIEQVVDHLKKEKISQVKTKHLLSLAECLWDFNHVGGKYIEAFKISQTCLEIALAAHGEKSNAVASSYHNLGVSFHELGRYEEALNHYEKAMEISKELLGYNHSDIAETLNNMGETYAALGKHKKALKYHKEALRISQDILGPKDADVATSLDNLGGVYEDLGEYQKALKYHEEALQMRQELLGPKHPHLAISLNNVAETYRALGKYEKALQMHKKALKMRQELLGNEHLDVATSLSNVGLTYGELRKDEKALKYTQEALKMRQELLGNTHLDVAISLDNLGGAYQGLGKYKTALKYHRKALKMKQELLGLKHPDVANSLGNVGWAYGELRQHQQALHYHKQALQMRQELLGNTHPDVAISLDNLGEVYQGLAKYKTALKYHREALKMRQEVLGSKHPDVATTLNNVGLAYGNLRKYKAALKYHRQALKITQELLGSKHPDIVTSLENLKNTYKNLGKYKKARRYKKEALKIKENLLKYEHNT